MHFVSLFTTEITPQVKKVTEGSEEEMLKHFTVTADTVKNKLRKTEV